jgi:hypothetical protein
MASRTGPWRNRARDFAMAFVGVLAGCGGAAYTACQEPGAGVEHVVVRGAGVWAEAGSVPRFEELWRVGGGHEEQHFGFPVHAAAGPDGVVAVPDFMLAELILVGAKGEWRSGVLRRGSGPGEVQAPVAVGWDDAGRLSVLDLGNARRIVVDSHGHVLEEAAIAPSIGSPVLTRGELVWAGIHSSGAVYVMPGFDDVPGRPRTKRAFALRQLPGMVESDTLVAAAFPVLDTGDAMVSPPAPGALVPRLSLGPDGTVAVVGHANGYEIDLYAADGRHVRRLCRADARPVPWSDAERGREAVDEEFAAVRDAAAAAILPATPPALGRVMIDADSRLWAQRDRLAATDVTWGLMYGTAGALWDVFDAAGTFLGEVRLPPGARLQAAAGEQVWAFMIGELGETWLVAYRLAALGDVGTSSRAASARPAY